MCLAKINNKTEYIYNTTNTLLILSSNFMTSSLKVECHVIHLEDIRLFSGKIKNQE